MTGCLQIENLKKLESELPSKFYDKIISSVDFIVDSVDAAEQIYLFGSCARCEPKWDSDIDLAVISEFPITDHYLRGYVIDTLDGESKFGVRADVIFRTQVMADISKTFKEVFDQDKILLWERGDNFVSK